MYHPFDQKCLLWFCVVTPTRCGLSPLLPNLFGKLWSWGENPTQEPKSCSFSPPEKVPLINLHHPQSKMSVIPPSYSNFHVIILYKLHLQLQSFPVTSCFIFSLYVHRCHLQHDRRIEWLKYPKTKFAFLPPFNAIWKTLLLIMLVLIFFPFPFLFQDLWNFTWPHSSCDFMTCELIKSNEFQISSNRPIDLIRTTSLKPGLVTFNFLGSSEYE